MSSVGEDRTETGRKVTVAEAAQALDTTADAIRSRIKRGTLQSVKEKNTVYVFLRPDQTPPEHRPDDDQTTARTQSDATALIAEMRDHIEDLREQLEAERQAHSEARRLLLSALEKIPAAIELPASEAPEPRESAEMADDEQQGRGPTPDARGPQEGTERRSWWREFFGFD